MGNELKPEVTQADRSIAELSRRGIGGKYDRDVESLAATIAAHRTASTAAMQERIDVMAEALARILEWWPENSENGRQYKGGSFGDDIRAARAALKGKS